MPADVFRKIDGVVENVDGLLARVDVTLVSVDDTLCDATAVLSDVRDLLVELRGELGVLAQVPAMATQLAELHQMMTASNGTAKKPTRAAKSTN